MLENILLEGCIESIEEANHFKTVGVKRLELCSNLDQGGLCPSLELVDYCVNKLKIDSVIMLRLRNDFLFLESDLSEYERLIKEYKKLGANSFIFGFLTNDEIDVKSCQKIISLLSDSKKAFHMAIDCIKNYEDGINQLIEMKFDWVLTKGGNNKTAIENIDIISSIIKYEDKIKLLIGGKVTNDNWEEIASKTGATWFHGRKIA
ncbi:MAG: copper homeostasis protein CutC [Mycoplasma sp.]